MIIEIQEKLQTPYMWVVPMYVPILEFHGHEHHCLWYYVFIYHIGRVLCKQCLVLDGFTHPTIQRHIIVEIKA